MWNKILLLIERIGTSPEDDADTRLQKNLLVSGSVMFITAGILWGILYIILGEPYPGLIPLLYGIFSAASVVHFAFTQRYHFFRFAQLLLILLLPFFLQIALGGFVNSSAVVLWALICPLSALLFGNLTSAHRWFAAYLGMVVLSGLLQPLVRVENNLSRTLIFGFFVMNLVGVSTIVFVQFRYFTVLKDRAYLLLHREQAKSEKLLLNVLPKEIAPILKEDHRPNGRTIAERFEAVSVLFADVVGFTSLSVELSPEEMVELLNEVFSYFDSLVERYDLEKIRTIGDNYMVVAGAPRRRPDHAQAIARLALDMLR
ncbi:MAG TPA: adenylate/guanylate cyclase domain-containing protein, partial [Anaerolineales bacterium]|nr:adenylate/guanylate cyclase domain-containing protein [Anaerolineales bacterium]